MEQTTIFARIINMNVKVLCADEEVYRYVCRELELHICEGNEQTQNIIIDIKNEEFTNGNNLTKVNECAYTDNCKVYICVEAFLRKTWIVIDTKCKESIYVELFINKRNDRIKRFCAPNFQYPWQNSIVDFFHGIFLWLIEKHLLDYGVTLVHAAAFVHNEKCILLAADAAAGKSTVVDDIVRRYRGKYIAEDYCFVDGCGNVYGLFNQRRILTSKKECKGMQDFCNFILFTVAKKLRVIHAESIRIRSTRELYLNSDIITQGYRCEGIFLTREVNDKMFFDCAEHCVKVMENEIRNWDGCMQLMNAIDTLIPAENICEDFFERLDNVVKKSIYASNMRLVSIPYMNTKEQFVDCLYDEMERVKNEDGN